MVSPFNGEGISYAMESGRYAAEFLERAALTNSRLASDYALHGYADHIRTLWGRHFTLGRVFAGLIGKPSIMQLALRTGMPVPPLMHFVVRLMANLTDAPGTPGRDLSDRAAHLLEQLVPETSNTQVRLKS